MTRRLYRDGALADGRDDRLRRGVSILVEEGRITWIRPSDDEGPIADPGDVEVVDASGSTIVPGMVDAHSHLTMPGGAHWIDRGSDPTDRLLEVAEANARLLTQAGVRWARDVGSVRRADPADGGRERALALGVRDRWRGRTGYPHVRAAGTWIMARGQMPALSVEAADGDELLAAAIGQLDDGADLVKLYLDGPDLDVSPWSVDELRRRGGCGARARRTGDRAQRLPRGGAGRRGGRRRRPRARVRARRRRRGDDGPQRRPARVDARRDGLVADVRDDHRRCRGSPRPRVARGSAARRERAMASLAIAHRAGVSIATGTDFGGGSTRANQLAWEVEQLVEAGLEPWEALGCATWRGGELLGEPDAGVIREGGPADFALVHGDPVSDPTALWRVWHVAWAG